MKWRDSIYGVNLITFDTGQPRNPFRDRTMRKEYAAAVLMWRQKHKNFFLANGDRHQGNNFAGFFWRGWDNLMAAQWDRASKQIIGYAYWRAGRDLARSS